jgi:GNAT superfamily N-acetyltransferase
MAVPRDCEGVARVRSACFPAWPVSGDEVTGTEARRPRDRLHVAWVAVQRGEIAAYGYVEEPNVAAVPGRIRIRVLVAPAYRGHGIGGALCGALIARAL